MGLGILPPPGLAPANAPLVQDFTSSTTATPPPGALYVFAECIGGSSPLQGGSYMSALIPVSSLAAPYAVTVGAAGTSSSSGGNSTFAGVTGYGGLVSPPAATTVNTHLDGGGPGNPGGTSMLGGGGGGSPNGALGGAGGTGATALGLLKAGNGGGNFVLGTAPGGAGGVFSTTGLRGAIRLTWIF